VASGGGVSRNLAAGGQEAWQRRQTVMLMRRL